MSFFQKCQLQTIRQLLTMVATCALVQAFVSCQLDYCNSFLAGVTDVYLRHIQLVQNAVARLVSGTCRQEYARLVLATLYWLPAHQRVTFKTAVLVRKCLHNATPRYLDHLCVSSASAASRRQSRSVVSGDLLIHVTRTSLGHSSFAVYGPRIWLVLRLSEVWLFTFKRQLKTHTSSSNSVLVAVTSSGVSYTVDWRHRDRLLASSSQITNVPTQLNTTRQSCAIFEIRCNMLQCEISK